MAVRIVIRPSEQAESGREAFRQIPDQIWAVDEAGPWVVSLRLVNQAGTFVVGATALEPLPHQPVTRGGLRAATINTLALGRLKANALAALVDFAADERNHEALSETDYWIGPADVLPAAKTGRPRHDAELAEVAYLYVVAQGRSRSPVKEVAKWNGINTVTPTTEDLHAFDRLRQRLHRARTYGFLTQAPSKGMAGGLLTPRAVEVMRAHPELGERLRAMLGQVGDSGVKKPKEQEA